MRDFTESQYRKRLEHYGFKPCGFMGYYSLPAPHNYLNVCSFNGGMRRRDRLSYLLTEWEREQRKNPSGQ